MLSPEELEKQPAPGGRPVMVDTVTPDLKKMIADQQARLAAKIEEHKEKAEAPPPSPATPQEGERLKVVGFHPTKDVPPEMWTSYVVSLEDDDGRRSEFLVPRNVSILIKDLEDTRTKHGEKFAASQVMVYKVRQNPQDPKTAFKVEVASGTPDEVIARLTSFKLGSKAAFRRVLSVMEEIFERTDCVLLDIMAFFEKEGMTGNTLASPHVELDRDTAKRFYNGMAGHAEMFKNNMKLHGVDIDKGEIVKAPAGFNPKRGQ